MTSVKLRVWIEGAIVAALAIVLSMIPTTIGTSFTISLGMIPLSIYAIRRGLAAGLFSGLVWGLLHFVTGDVWFLSVSQVIIEYVIAFTFAGFAGIFTSRIQKNMHNGQKGTLSLMVGAVFIGTLARFFWHFVAGFIFWGKYALWGLGPVAFSLVENGISGLLTAVVTAIGVVLIYQVYPQVFTAERLVTSSVSE
ncbi:energy-coupled thiamine transporter ThiT [Vagococcus lutrae]|uniref:energy-coupled thiamine transporter ThiT n=1 Tax=Vagococcus lutrae TaxID=81947 RepID=UPI0023AA17A8|nr:energy-coupled thiamine transporter ThiT [Vagococcus lutrae]WEB81545.1 energy-coupled thiamine transporter ThiT [Vagococcus lutrae]